MAFDNIAKACIIATLAAVEAGGDYGVITAPDTLSLGIGQWTQGRAYDLLKRFPVGFSFGNTVDTWLSYGRDYWTYDNVKYQYLSSADRDYLSDSLASDTGHKIQDSQMQMDLENDYLPRMRELGMDPDTETDACMELIVVMHRWGNYASILNECISYCQHPIDFDQMKHAIIMSGEYNMVPNRYNVAWPMIQNRVTNGVVIDGENPGGGTQPAPSNPGQNNVPQTGTEKPKAAEIHYVEYIGDNTVIIRMEKETITCYPMAHNRWAPRSASTRTAETTQEDKPTPNPPTPPTPGNPDTGLVAQMTALARSVLGTFAYSQGYGRLNPEHSGVTDCSGFVWWLYNKICGIDIGTGGTQDIYDNDVGQVVASGSGTFDAQSLVQEGDLLVGRYWEGYGHVEYCLAGGYDSIGQAGPHDGDMGPTENTTGWFKKCEWKLKRYV